MRYHTGYVGNLKTYSYKTVLNKKPELLVLVWLFSIIIFWERLCLRPKLVRNICRMWKFSEGQLTTFLMCLNLLLRNSLMIHWQRSISKNITNCIKIKWKEFINLLKEMLEVKIFLFRCSWCLALKWSKRLRIYQYWCW